MVSLFPMLFTYEMLAPFLLRLTLGLVFIYWTMMEYKMGHQSWSDRALISLHGITGLLLVIGLWTQAAALAAGIYLTYRLVQKIQTKSFLTDGVNYYLILFVISISLLFLGAGAFAMDYPL